MELHGIPPSPVPALLKHYCTLQETLNHILFCSEVLCLKRILPKSDEDPLKQIGRYLKLAQDEGIIMKPSVNLRIDVYPDVDLTDLFGY